MHNNSGQIFRFLEHHAVFIDQWGYSVVLGGFFLVIILIYLFNHIIRTIWLKISITGILMVFLVIFTLFTFKLNSPLHTFISTVATVTKTIGSKPPVFEFIDLKDHQIHTLSDFHDKAIILTFWDIRCESCIEQLKVLTTLEISEQGKVVVIALTPAPADTIINFLLNHVSPSIVGLYPDTSWIDVGEYVPFTIMLDREGRVREYFYGEKDLRYLRVKVKEYTGQ